MKKGIEILGTEFVLDEFRLSEYTAHMARLCGETEESREELEKTLRGWIREEEKHGTACQNVCFRKVKVF